MEDKKYNILVVHNHYQLYGGEDTVVKNEIELLKSHGHNVILYERDNNEIKQFNLFKKILLPFTTIFSLKTYKDVKRIIKEKKIDIVHVHNTLPIISPSVFYAAIRSKTTVVQTIHNFRMICPNGLLYRDGHICEDCISNGLKCAVKHKCYRNSRLQTLLCAINMKIHRVNGIYKKINYICLTDFNREKLLQLKFVDSKKVYVKPNFIDNYYKKTNNQRKKQFIYVGRLDESKGIRDLIKIWDRVNDKRLIVCGTGPLEEELKQYVEANKLNVLFLGQLKKEDVLNEVAESQALIFPSKWYEGFPMSLLDAMSVNTPIIVNNIGNGSCIVKDNKGKMIYSNSNELIAYLNDKHFDPISLNRSYMKDYNYQLLIDIYSDILKIQEK